MKKYLIKYSALIFAYICALPVFGLDLSSAEGIYTVKIPGNWKVTFQNQAGFSITGTNVSRTMTLIIGNVRSGRLDASTIASLDRGFQSGGAQILSSKMFAIDGVPAYEIIQRLGKRPYASVMVYHYIIADKKLYLFSASVIGGDASTDTEMREGLASFHFIHPPALPSAFGFRPLQIVLVILTVIIVLVALWIWRRKA